MGMITLNKEFMLNKIVPPPGEAHVFEIFSGGKKIGISVARNIDEALLFATNATTRKTSSKMNTTCDYEELTIGLLNDAASTMQRMRVAYAAQEKCVPLGRVSSQTHVTDHDLKRKWPQSLQLVTATWEPNVPDHRDRAQCRNQPATCEQSAPGEQIQALLRK